MPTNFDLIRKRNHIPVRENRETSAVKTESRNSGLPKTKSGGIDWDAIRKKNGIRVENAQDDATRIRNKLNQVLSPSRTATVENSRRTATGAVGETAQELYRRNRKRHFRHCLRRTWNSLTGISWIRTIAAMTRRQIHFRTL